VKESIPWDYVSGEKKDELEAVIENKTKELIGEIPPREKGKYRNISLKLNVPTGKLADIVRIVNYIKSKFEEVKIRVEIVSKKGEMTATEYDDKIREAVNMASVEVEEEELE
jgi:hypothetical protein